MQTILIASLALNMFLIGVIIYLYRTEDKRQEEKNCKKVSDEIRRAIDAAAAYAPGPSSSIFFRRIP